MGSLSRARMASAAFCPQPMITTGRIQAPRRCKIRRSSHRVMGKSTKTSTQVEKSHSRDICHLPAKAMAAFNASKRMNTPSISPISSQKALRRE